ncbi:MAG: SDR family oxidoreductase [Pseudomonadota bacterium]
MKTVLVAGATGYLGQHVVRALSADGYSVRALGRNEQKLDSVRGDAHECVVGDITNADSLSGVCDGVDVVFSSVGITRQKDGLTYRDVDYRANRNLLAVAESAGVEKFIYVHVLNADKMRHVRLIQAKQAFVEELESADLDHTIVCPTGFFSDMEEFLSMALSGRVYLFGDGHNRVNPVHGADLAEVCSSAVERSVDRIEVGGPEVFTYREIAELAFQVVDKPVRISAIPKSLISAAVGAMRWLTPMSVYGPVQFMASVMTMDIVGEPHGQRTLKEHFRRRSA